MFLVVEEQDFVCFPLNPLFFRKDMAWKHTIYVRIKMSQSVNIFELKKEVTKEHSYI